MTETARESMHGFHVRQCVQCVIAALASNNPAMAAVWLRDARDHARMSEDNAHTHAERMSATYMQNFVADMTTVMRRDGLVAEL